VAANATSAVAVLPGYLASAYGFRRDIAAVEGLGLGLLLGVSLVGGLIGAGLLLVTPNDTFEAIVPVLLLIATALFAFGNRLARLMRTGGGSRLGVLAGLLAVSVYGGYFNGGLGILLLAAFSLSGLTDLHAMNGLKNWMSAAISLISVAAFAVAGKVAWAEAAIMMAAATAGGYAGTRVAKRIPPAWLRAGIVATGLVMAALFALRG